MQKLNLTTNRVCVTNALSSSILLVFIKKRTKVTKWWSSLLLLGFIFGVSMISPNSANAQYHPYYTGNTPPPMIERYFHYYTGNLAVTIISPFTSYVTDDIYSIHLAKDGNTTLLTSGTLQNGNIVRALVPIVEGSIIVVTAKPKKPSELWPANSIGLVLWTDTISKYDMCINPNNPYDYYGQVHNEGLDYYINHRTYFGSDSIAVMNDIVGRLRRFAQNNPAFANENINDISLNASVLPPIHNNSTVNSLTQTLYRMVYFLAEEQDISNCINNIKQLEDGMNNYVKNQTVTEEDAADFYKMSAVAKYSLVYWYEVSMNANSPWHNFEDYGDDEVSPTPIISTLISGLKAVGSAIASAATTVAGYATSVWGTTINFFGYPTNILGTMWCAGLDIGGVPGGLFGAIASSAVGGYIWGQPPFPGWR